MDQDTAQTKASPAIAIKMVIGAAVGDKRQMSFETYIDHETPQDVAHALADRLMGIVDRQVTKYELQDLKKYLKREEDLLESIKGDLARMDAEHVKAGNKRAATGTVRNPNVLTPKEEQERKNVLTNIENRTKHVAAIKVDIAEREAKLK